jgi:ubiquinone/menaquinone biosynthesis C-methylase UbiE
MLKKYTHPKQLWDWRQYGALQLGPVKGQKVLDLGCGMGEESVYFAMLGADVTAIDISPVGIELVKKRAAHNGVAERIRACAMRADETEFADGSFDVVHGFGILHHIGLEKGLKEVKRVLKPGGRGLFFEHMGNSALIERLRKRADYTEYEQPLRWKEIMAFKTSFSKYTAQPFHVTSRLRFISRIFNRPIVKRFDHLMLRLFPFLKHYAGGVVIYLEK